MGRFKRVDGASDFAHTAGMKTSVALRPFWTSIGLVGASLVVLGMASRRMPSCEETTVRMLREVRRAIRERTLDSDLQRYLAYVGSRMDASAGTNTFSDKNGACRLGWVDRLIRDPLQAPLEAERFSRQMQEAFGQQTGAIGKAVVLALEKLDSVPIRSDWRSARSSRLELKDLSTALARIQEAWERVWTGMAEEERSKFCERLVQQALGDNVLGHRFADAREGRAVAEYLERLERRSFALAAREAAALTDRFIEGHFNSWLDWWMDRPATGQVEGVEGPVLAAWETPQGLVVIGGVGPNIYRLDENFSLAVILDLGGDDRYEEGTVGPHRSILLVYDRSGDDVYNGIRTGIQGSAIGGVSLLIDGGGNDTYEAADLAQGSVLAGIGILVDVGGNDRYRADRRAQGHAVGGIGLLLDRTGDDVYHGAMLVQGVGGPWGIGILADNCGNDRYFAGGKYPGGYDDSPGFGGWSQGVGVGPRGAANGGIGLLLEGAGDDVYEYDYFSHGGGYWFAAGIARDFGGNDQRRGSGTNNWDGTPRTVKPFVRWGPAYGCHYAVGFLFDDQGNDFYRGTTAGPCFSWDLALAVLCDAEGDDEYIGSGLGQAAQGGIVMLFDGAGSDRYRGGRQTGWADPSVAYHPELATNANFTFLFDRGDGPNVWEGMATNGNRHLRGWAGGVLEEL